MRDFSTITDHSALNDSEFLSSVKSGEFPAKQLSFDATRRLGFLLCAECLTPADALLCISETLYQYKLKTDTYETYQATLTSFWARMIVWVRQQTPRDIEYSTFVAEWRKLIDMGHQHHFYSADVWESDRAKNRELVPDVKPLPPLHSAWAWERVSV